MFQQFQQFVAQIDTNNIISKVKGAVLNYSEYQLKVDEATSNQPCKLYLYLNYIYSSTFN